MSETIFDVAVIGGGPGGYVAAIRASQLGLKTVCIDKWKNAAGKTVFGGTCLNVGCIPSKALLESSQNYVAAREHFAEHGIKTKGVAVDLAQMQKRKEKVVTALVGGVSSLFKKNKVEAIGGAATIESLGEICEIKVATDDGERSVRAKNLIVATGSVPRAIPPAPFDGESIVDNEGALSFSSIPKTLGVVGAGVIGLELGSVWKRLGSEVVILEALPDFLSAADSEIAAEAFRIFTRKQKLDIRMGAQVVKAARAKSGKVEVEWKADGKSEKASFDKLVVAVGRRPYCDGLNLEGVGIALDARGCIEVDAQCRVSGRRNVFALGDVVRGPMLAHKAEDEGQMVAEIIAGQKPEIDYGAIPWVIYTHPEIAWVGKTERELKAEGIEYRVGKFPFLANGRARGQGETDGMVKIVACAKTDRVLGAHIIGQAASEMIAEMVLAIEFGAASEDIARTCHAHPTLSEATREAALAVAGRAIHI